jgi:hypothetical protein
MIGPGLLGSGGERIVYESTAFESGRCCRDIGKRSLETADA